jgi:hypothetical protein
MSAVAAPAPASRSAALPVATTSAAIPFRESSPVAGPDMLWSLGTTALVLAAFAAAAWQAHRRGWLNRWISKPIQAEGTGGEGMRVLERLRVSRRTTVYRIGDGSRQLLLVESDCQARFLDVSPSAAERSGP